MKRILLAGLLLALSTFAPAHATRIDFDSLEQAGDGFQFFSQYEEDGFRISTDITFASAQQNNPDWYAGSAGAFNNYDGGVTTLTKIDGGVFSLLAVDLALVSPLYGGGAPITFIGTLHAGGSVSQTVNVGQALAFSTFALVGFTGLDSVSWTQDAPYHQFDSLELRYGVPEPVSLALFALALTGLCAVRRRFP